MDGTFLNTHLPRIQANNFLSPLSTRNQVSELNSDTIESMLVSLTVLGFEKMRCFCEQKSIRSITEDDIRNLISQQGLDNNQVQIDWLLTLNEKGVEKVLEIINNLHDKKKEGLFLCYGGTEQLEMNVADFKIVKARAEHAEYTERRLCTSLAEYIQMGSLCLSEDLRRIENKEPPLHETQLRRLSLEGHRNLNSHMEFKFGSTLQNTSINKIIAEANQFELKAVGGCKGRHFLFFKTVYCLDKSQQQLFVQKNKGFVLQLTLQCLTNNDGYDGDEWHDYFNKKALELLAELVNTKMAKVSPKLSQNMKSSSQITHSPNLISCEEVNNLPELNPDVQGGLFEHMFSITEQWSFAITSKANLKGYVDFCTSNLKNDGKVSELKTKGFSEIHIFMHYPRLRKDPFVPLCPAGLNSLVYEVLGPNAIELIRKGMLSIIDAKKIATDFNEEMKGKPIQEQGLERYRWDGSLTQEDLDHLDVEKSKCLGSRLVQFAINSSQLTIAQAIEARERFSDDFFWSCIRMSHRNLSLNDAHNAIEFLFVSGKLSVKRFSKLTAGEIGFLCDASTFSYMKEDLITLDLALFISGLREAYKKSGSYRLSLLLSNLGLSKASPAQHG
jgi:hypothetical protein